MACDLVALVVDAHDPRALAAFWGGLLDWPTEADPYGGFAVLPDDDTGFRIRFATSQARRTGPNRMHPDLTSTSPQDQQQRVARALALGGRHLDVGQGPDADQVVLADPDGNEFCLLPGR